jgi:DegV family protein with EDD domain
MIRIVTDSGCDLPPGRVERHGIAVVPLTVRFGDEEFVDGEDLDGDDFWSRLTGGEMIPQTSAPPVGRFTAAYDRLAREGASGIVVLAMSSAISATHRAATLAAEGFGDVPIRVVDTRLVSGALGLAVIETAEAAATDADLDVVAAVAADASEATDLFATVDTLEYLRRGGRIGTASAFIGGLLDVKPLISFEVGAVTGVGRVRTRRRAIAAVLDHVAELGERVRRLAVIHSDPPDLDEFVAAVADLHGAIPEVIRIGPVVGTHSGPGVAGVVYRLD